MSAADNETIAQQLPRVLDDAYKALTDARAALKSAANAHAAAVREHTEALSAARAAGLAGAADAETRGLDERDAERREHVARVEERRAKEAYRDAIETLEDGASRARRWLADASAGGAPAESVTAAESAINTAERRAYVERLRAEERGWIRRARPAPTFHAQAVDTPRSTPPAPDAGPVAGHARAAEPTTDELAWEARALGLLAQDSTLTVAEIARRVGMHRRTLYRSSKFKAALKARSAAGRMHRLVQGTTLATAAAPEDDTRPVARNSRPRPGRHNY